MATRILRTALAASLSAALLAGAGQARPPEEDPEALLGEPGAPPAILRNRLAKLAPGLASSDEALASPGFATWSAGDEKDRKLFRGLAQDVHGGCRKALSDLGFTPPERGTLSIAIRVAVADPVPQAFVSDDGSAVLFRDPIPTSTLARPAPPERFDGPPMLRDLLAASARGRTWLRRERVRARSQGPGSFGHACARSLVQALDLPPATPPWVREGLAALVDAKAHGEGAVAPHLSGTCAPSSAAAAWKAILAGGPVPEGAVPVLGRAMESLLQGKADARDRIARLAAGAKPESPEVFGADPMQAIVAAAGKMAPEKEGCRADGTIACFLCRGSGRHVTACPECEGMGAVPCPSCGGSDICSAPRCDGGFWPIPGDESRGYDCDLCNGDGFTWCKACKDPAIKCLACKGQSKITWPCPLCVRGRLPCPGCPTPEDGGCATCSGKASLPCGMCATGKTDWTCAACGGAGYRGCATCNGMGWYGDEQNNDHHCKSCIEGRSPCSDCNGKGGGKLTSDRCPAHPGGEPAFPCPGCAPPEPPKEAETSTTEPAGIDAAISFLNATRDNTGAYATRFRGTKEAAGALRKHNLFSNAVSLWTLFTAGKTREDPAIAGAWKVLVAESEVAATAAAVDTGTQEAAFALRALLVGGMDPKSKVVQGLVSRLVRSQRADGLWADDIKTREVRGDVLNALIVVEALRVAKDRGISVPSDTWSRAHSAAQKLFSSRQVKAKRGEILHGTDVACCVSLVVLTKAGSLGAKAATFDYLSLPEVKAGLAWLDRHFDPRGKPTYLNGARVHRRDLEGYYAYMYSMQRLAMLLGISDFNGSRWFPDGAAHLAKVQRKDGSFEEIGYGGLNGSQVCTTFAILFLVRATTPITESTSR